MEDVWAICSEFHIEHLEMFSAEYLSAIFGCDMGRVVRREDVHFSSDLPIPMRHKLESIVCGCGLRSNTAHFGRIRALGDVVSANNLNLYVEFQCLVASDGAFFISSWSRVC